ncbi:MAG: DUF4190 domain-containing protein [Mycolicibacterium sp.]|nr:DUF4190 domain-containing protein [Mycolicibacterium sp.]
MTSEDSNPGQTSSPDSGAGGSEPSPQGYESPPIEDTPRPDEQDSGDSAPAYANSYEPPSYEQPRYDQPSYEPQYGQPQYGQSQFGQQAPPQYGTPGNYPPPPPYGAAPGYGPPPGYPPPGYGAPGYGAPGYGAPGYGAPGYPAYGAQPTKTNALAIASLVASVVSLCGIGSIAGIILGVVAINQIKVSGESGRGLALAGIIVGAVTLLFSMLWLVLVAAA